MNEHLSPLQSHLANEEPPITDRGLSLRPAESVHDYVRRLTQAGLKHSEITEKLNVVLRDLEQQANIVRAKIDSRREAEGQNRLNEGRRFADDLSIRPRGIGREMDLS